MEDTISQLATELNDLFGRISHVLDKIEACLTPDACIECVTGFHIPSLLLFSRLSIMLNKRLPVEPIRSSNAESNITPDDHQVLAQAGSQHEDSQLPQDHREASLHDIMVSITNSNSDSNASTSHHRAIGNSRSLDQRNDLYRRLDISPNLYSALVEYNGNPQYFLKSTRLTSSSNDTGLTGAFIRLHQKREDIQDDKTREVYLQMHFLHRRFEYRNFFLLAKRLEYHDGKRWGRNACGQLAKKIHQECPSLKSLDTETLLEEYVRLGRAYNKWAEELGSPGCLLALPLTVTEYQ